jgi:hypothetical protein
VPSDAQELLDEQAVLRVVLDMEDSRHSAVWDRSSGPRLRPFA